MARSRPAADSPVSITQGSSLIRGTSAPILAAKAAYETEAPGCGGISSKAFHFTNKRRAVRWEAWPKISCSFSPYAAATSVPDRGAFVRTDTAMLRKGSFFSTQASGFDQRIDVEMMLLPAALNLISSQITGRTKESRTPSQTSPSLHG